MNLHTSAVPTVHVHQPMNNVVANSTDLARVEIL